MSADLAKEYEEDIEFGLKEYERAVVESLAFLAEGGRLPGIEQADPDEVRQFFRSIEPQQWLGLAATNPQKAVELLKEFMEVERGVA